MKRRAAWGFSLLEVVVALGILSVTLVVLLESAGQGYANAGRTRDMSLLVLLARHKMIALEQQLFHDGFVINSQEDRGDFGGEGYPEVHWATKVFPIRLELSGLAPLCEMMQQKSGLTAAANSNDSSSSSSGCAAALAAVGQVAGNFMQELSDALRIVDLTVSQPQGAFSPEMHLRVLLTRDDFMTEQMSDDAHLQNQAAGGQLGQPPLPAAPGANVGH